MKRSIQSLPKWAQEKILRLTNEHVEMRHQLAAAKAANEVCSKMEWTAIGNRVMCTENRKLFFLDKDVATWVCTIGPDDVLLIGRRAATYDSSATDNS